MTLSTYCVEHELLIRVAKETERANAAHPAEADADAPLTAAVDDAAHEPAAL